MTNEPFLRPRLVGARFEGHSIPLEVLKDLAVLEELIVEVAKSEFLKDHPSRRRSPRGFTEGIALKLTGIEEGSTVPVISLFIADTAFSLADLFSLEEERPPEKQVYFERARDAVVNAIGAAEQNQSIIEYLPEKTLGYFDRLGRSLREGEAIEFTTPTRQSPARLTRETRRKLILASSRVKELTEDTVVRGAIPEADQDDMTFELQLFDGRKIKAPMTAQHLDTILEAFNAFKSGTRVLMQGIGLFNRTEKLIGFESVEHISVLDPLDVPSRLDELRLLRDGWYEGAGKAPTSAGIDWLSDTFTRAYPEDLPLPFVYPTPEGGIRLEWSIEPHDVTLDLNLARHTASLHHLNLTSDDDHEEKLNLDEPAEWERLIQRIRNLAGSFS
jgi:hypothetical protein